MPYMYIRNFTIFHFLWRFQINMNISTLTLDSAKLTSFAVLTLLAASAYSGFIFLQWPHPETEAKNYSNIWCVDVQILRKKLFQYMVLNHYYIDLQNIWHDSSISKKNQIFKNLFLSLLESTKGYLWIKFKQPGMTFCR